MRKIFLYLTAIMLAACTYDPPTQPADWYDNPISYADQSQTHPHRAEFQAYLDSAVAEGLPGAVLLIRTPDDGTWVGAAGYTDIAGDVRWQPNTISRVGSVTKMFAGAVLLKVCASHGIALDAAAKPYLPEKVVSKVANAETCTIRQLLNHTSGINNYLGSPSLIMEAYGSYDYDYQPKEKLIEYAFDQDAEFAAGTSWHYSNSNFLLLEMIAENITGVDSRTLMDSLIIKPLNLRSTTYNPSAALPKGLARGYADLFTDGRLTDVTETDLERFHFDGGVISTVYDLADFIDALFLSSFLNENLKAELIRTVNTHGESERGTDYYGSGIILEKHPRYGNIYGHSGTAVGYSAHLYHIENADITIAALINGSQNTIEDQSYKWFSPLEYDKILHIAAGK
ncbi:MAG: serine hydrolase [Caldithrix sp.]|nr:serine hydrolase [Caldithrix sp.]